MLAGVVVAGFGLRGLRAYRRDPGVHAPLARHAVLVLGGVGIAAVAAALLPFAATGALSDTVVLIIGAVLLVDAAMTASIAEFVGRTVSASGARGDGRDEV